MVLERVDIFVDTGLIIRYGLSTTPLTNFTANLAMRDTRPGILNVPVAQVRDVQQAGGIAAFGQLEVQANKNISLIEKKGLFVLAPGTGVTFATTVVNQASFFSFWWRERTAEPSELNFP